jgi:hypothetical protein
VAARGIAQDDADIAIVNLSHVVVRGDHDERAREEARAPPAIQPRREDLGQVFVHAC